MTNAAIFAAFQNFLRHSETEHELGDPAAPSDLRFVPPPLQPFYRKYDGAALFDGDILFFLAAGDSDEDGTIQHASRLAREAEWPIPQDVVLFGRDTGGEVLGLWTGPRDNARFPSPIILTGLVFKPAAHSLLATSFERYLLTTVVWHCLGTEIADIAFTDFQVPENLRAEDLDELDAEAWFAWADPDLPALPGDPYEEPLTAAQLQTMLAGRP